MFSLIKQAFCLKKKKKKNLDSFFGNLSWRQAKSQVRSLYDQVTKKILQFPAKLSALCLTVNKIDSQSERMIFKNVCHNYFLRIFTFEKRELASVDWQSTLAFKSRLLRQVKGAEQNFNLFWPVCCLFINDIFF